MGNYLASPNSTKHSDNGTMGNVDYGVSSMQGWRVSMEDAHLIHYFDKIEPADVSGSLFGIYDGHGGAQVAQYVSRHLIDELLRNPDFRRGRFDSAFRSVYVAIDAALSGEDAQSELELFANGSCRNSDISNEPQSITNESQSTKPEPSVRPPTNGTIVNDTPQKSSLRALGGKIFHRRGERKRKTMDTSESDQSDRRDTEESDETSSSVEVSSSKNSQIKCSNSNSIFSLNGIRSLFSNILKIGSTNRTAQVNQGLAMLSGCTAVTVLVTDKKIVVANAGDSRCVLCRGSLAIELSKDHKPQLPGERSRIYSAGGWLEMGRVNGNLNLSRALGDLVYKCNSSLSPDKQIVSGVPDVSFVDITDEDEFLVVGCDGIWESTSSQEMIDFIRDRINDAHHLSDVLETLFEELLSPNPTLFEFGCDNMTAILVDLQPESRRLRRRDVRALSSSLSCDSFASVAQQTTVKENNELSIPSDELSDSKIENIAESCVGSPAKLRIL